MTLRNVQDVLNDLDNTAHVYRDMVSALKTLDSINPSEINKRAIASFEAVDHACIESFELISRALGHTTPTTPAIAHEVMEVGNTGDPSQMAYDAISSSLESSTNENSQSTRSRAKLVS